MKKLTDWFPGAVKPVHAGPYQRDWGDGQVFYSQWTGSTWLVGSNTAFDATHKPEQRVSGNQALPWRGVTEDEP